MDKNTQHNRSIRAVTMLLTGIMALPLAAQAFMPDPGLQTAELVSMFNEDIETIRRQAAEDRDRLRMQRRAYSRAMERCRERLADGEAVECPEMSDLGTYDLKGSAPENGATRQTPEQTGRSDLHLKGLSESERRELRKYTRAGFCSKAAGAMLYNVCLSIVGEGATTAPRGFENDQIRRHKKYSDGPATIRLRLQMIDEAISGTRRDTIRPTGYRE